MFYQLCCVFKVDVYFSNAVMLGFIITHRRRIRNQKCVIYPIVIFINPCFCLGYDTYFPKSMYNSDINA